MNILCEDSMLYGQEFFSDWGDVQLFSGNAIRSEDAKDADLLLVRSTTKVDESLLCENTRLKMVATATSGKDHFDTDYLIKRNIPHYAAVGCNAIAVAEYVLSALFTALPRIAKQRHEITVGIVGAGQVGTCLAKKLSALNIAYRLCDPPLQQSGDERDFVPMSEILKCDVISLHVPKVIQGEYKTYHLLAEKELANLSEKQILINASRGDVVCNSALNKRLDEAKPPVTILDVWEGEPTIDLELMQKVAIATGHIAGHTIEGKARGTDMVYRAVARQLGLSSNKNMHQFLPEANFPIMELTSSVLEDTEIAALVTQVYNIQADNDQFRTAVSSAEEFAYFRKKYGIRREFNAMQVNTGKTGQSQALYGLGFSPL